MVNEYFISIYLDKRRAKSNGKYPVKLRVFTHAPRKQKLYPTIFEFTTSEFEKIWENKKPRGEFREIRLKLQNLEANAHRMAQKLPAFSFEAFEQLLYGGDASNPLEVGPYYEKTIQKFKYNGQLGTASNYELSLKSLLKFHGNKKLTFLDIDPQWLRNYERNMLEEAKLSQTTVGIYLRPLRAIFNHAIADKVIDPEKYPFGKRKYNIPAPKGTKKALTKEQLKKLFIAIPKQVEHEKAKAFWFFSYACNGMNLKDIVNLKYKNISGEMLLFKRAKTANTNKSQAPVMVYMNEYIKEIIKKYGNKSQSPDDYIFPVVDPKTSPEEKLRQLQNFIRYINQHFRNFAKSLGIKEKVSTYWARHTFATNAIRNGASMEFVSEALSHSSINTTRAYFAGFENEEKKKFAKKLMDF